MLISFALLYFCRLRCSSNDSPWHRTSTSTGWNYLAKNVPCLINSRMMLACCLSTLYNGSSKETSNKTLFTSGIHTTTLYCIVLKGTRASTDWSGGTREKRGGHGIHIFGLGGADYFQWHQLFLSPAADANAVIKFPFNLIRFAAI